jgi:hypothetical protein
LSLNPHHRPSVSEVLDHPWIRVSYERFFYLMKYALLTSATKGSLSLFYSHLRNIISYSSLKLL